MLLGCYLNVVESTIGASFMSKLVVVDEVPIKFQIWDTAGQEKVLPTFDWK